MQFFKFCYVQVQIYRILDIVMWEVMLIHCVVYLKMLYQLLRLYSTEF
jgi:hypothetical protein